MTPTTVTRYCLKIQNNNACAKICVPNTDNRILDFSVTKPDAKLTFNITTGNIFSGNTTNFGGSRR